MKKFAILLVFVVLGLMIQAQPKISTVQLNNKNELFLMKYLSGQWMASKDTNIIIRLLDSVGVNRNLQYVYDHHLYEVIGRGMPGGLVDTTGWDIAQKSWVENNFSSGDTITVNDSTWHVLNNPVRVTAYDAKKLSNPGYAYWYSDWSYPSSTAYANYLDGILGATQLMTGTSSSAYSTLSNDGFYTKSNGNNIVLKSVINFAALSSHVNSSTTPKPIRIGETLDNSGLYDRYLEVDPVNNKANILSDIYVNGKVGIGTNTPEYALDLTVTNDVTPLKIKGYSTQTTTSNNPMVLFTNAANYETLRIYCDGGLDGEAPYPPNTGNLGIGRNVFKNFRSSSFVSNNTAFGVDALKNAGQLFESTALGAHALEGTTYGFDNTAVGAFAMSGDNSGGTANCAFGDLALSVLSGSYNVGMGQECGHSLTSGNGNIAIGRSSLSETTTGNYNIAIGYQAGNKTGTLSDRLFIGNAGHFGNSSWKDSTSTAIYGDMSKDWYRINGTLLVKNYPTLGSIPTYALAIGSNNVISKYVWPSGSQWITTGNDIYYSVGKVGIGTTSPTARLHVVGSSYLYGTVAFGPSDGSSSGILKGETVDGKSRVVYGGLGMDKLVLKTDYYSGEDQLVIQSDGKVGIGTVTPLSKFHIKGNDIKLESASGQGSTTFYMNPEGSDGAYFQTSTSSAILGANSIPFQIRSSGGTRALTFSTYASGGWHDRLEILPNGNVGINNVSPSYVLDVTGNIHSSSSIISDSYFNVAGAAIYSVGGCYLGGADRGGYSWSDQAHHAVAMIIKSGNNSSYDDGYISLQTSGVERMNISNTGVTTLTNILHLTPITTPTSPIEGDIYINSSDHHMYFFNGTAWKQLSEN